MRKEILSSLILLMISLAMFSQRRNLADRYYKEYAYPEAVKLYESIYKKDSSQYIVKRIADCYYKNSDTKKAMFWYSKLESLYQEKVSVESMFYYAQSLRSNGYYDKSDAILLGLNRSHLSDVKKKTQALLNKEGSKGRKVVVRNLDINTKFSDFGGFIHNNMIYYTSSDTLSSRKDVVYKWNNQPFLNLYKSEINPSSSQKEALSNKVNTEYHESNVIFTKDGKTIYFTRVNSINGRNLVANKENIVNLKLYSAKLIDNEWSDIKELPFNSDNYSVGHPALSPDEKILYFTSDMPGSYGETDIYKVSISSEGYGKPVNLGSKINTIGKEMFPFVSKENLLFFSSNGHPGLGLLDIFESKINKDGEFTSPRNLESPFNSNRDDFCFYLDDIGVNGYFSSNRRNGKGDDDIYSFSMEKDTPNIPFCSVSGLSLNEKTNRPLSNATIKLFDENGNLIDEIVSDSKGFYKFNKIVCNKDFTVLASRQDYKPDRKKIKDLNGDLIFNLNLKPLIIDNKIVINPIYFNFDNSDIREEAKYELENIVRVMNNYPDMKIKIESHTDSRGDKSYNLELSNRRAKTTRNYIVSRGIGSGRIFSAIGYGESRLLNDCDDSKLLKCSEQEHQSNRRSNFIIVNYSDVKNLDPALKVIDAKKP